MISPLPKPNVKALKSNPNLPIFAGAANFLVSLGRRHSHGALDLMMMLAPMAMVKTPKAMAE